MQIASQRGTQYSKSCYSDAQIIRKEFLQVKFKYVSPLGDLNWGTLLYYRNKHLPYHGTQAWYEAHLSYEYHFHLVLSCNTPSQSSGTKHKSGIGQEKPHKYQNSQPVD